VLSVSLGGAGRQEKTCSGFDSKLSTTMAASTPAATVTASTPAATVTAGALAVTSHVAITTITAPPSKPTEPDARSTVVTAADSDDMCRVACVTPNLTAATSHVAVTSATNPFTAFATLPADDDAPPTVAVEPPAVVFTPQPPAPPFAPPLPPLPPLISEHSAVSAVSDAPDLGPPPLPQMMRAPLYPPSLPSRFAAPYSINPGSGMAVGHATSNARNTLLNDGACNSSLLSGGARSDSPFGANVSPSSASSGGACSGVLYGDSIPNGMPSHIRNALPLSYHEPASLHELLERSDDDLPPERRSRGISIKKRKRSRKPGDQRIKARGV